MTTQITYQMKQNIKSLPFYGLLRHSQLAINVFIATLFFVLPGAAFANINSVSPSPATISVPAKGNATINVIWQVNRTEMTIRLGPTPRTVSSSVAELRVNGAVVATLAGAISTSSTLASGQTETVSLNESFSINAALASRIAKSPAGSVQVLRFFNDTQSGATGSVRLFTRSVNSGPLAVRRIDLAFENSARTDVVYKGDVVHAIADISFRSSGILKGEWRIIDPTASLGGSGGRVLRVVRQNLVSSGEGRTRLVSPSLPTNINGLHLVSFVVQADNVNIETPILRYFVLDDDEASIRSTPSKITVLSPENGANLSKNTVFKWQAVSSAQAYQVEFFNQGDTLPLTGKLVPATDLKLSLSAVSFEWLESGHEYNWHVRAFGTGGKLLGESDLKSISMP